LNRVLFLAFRLILLKCRKGISQVTFIAKTILKLRPFKECCTSVRRAFNPSLQTLVEKNCVNTFFPDCCQHIDKRPLTLVKPKLVHKLIKPGRIIFALGIIALGVLQFFAKDFIVGRPPSPAWAAAIPGKIVWAYLSGSLLVITGLAVILNKKAGTATIIMGLIIFIFSFLFRYLPDMTNINSIEDLLWKVGAYKTLALCGGAFIVAASFFKEKNRNSNIFFTNNVLVTIGWILLSIFLIDCGIAHFKFDDFVKDLVPAYIPAPYFWTYFAAVALLAGGTGLIFKQTRKWAAALSGIMILLWFAMLHIPRAINIPPYDSTPHYGEWMGVFESFSFSGIFFVLAGLSSKENFFVSPAGSPNV